MFEMERINKCGGGIFNCEFPHKRMNVRNSRTRVMWAVNGGFSLFRECLVNKGLSPCQSVSQGKAEILGRQGSFMYQGNFKLRVCLIEVGLWYCCDNRRELIRVMQH